MAVKIVDYLDYNGNLIYSGDDLLLNNIAIGMGQALKGMNNGQTPYANQKWDYSLVGEDNFNNLQTLSIDC